jgi:DNA-binding MarR family transcriptional regulator
MIAPQFFSSFLNLMAKSSPADPLTKLDYELLADFRYQLRRFLRFSEEVSQAHGITVLQYLLLLQVKGYPGREWATIAELAERLQSHHHGVVALTSRCEKAGLVARRPGRDDKRSVEVVLKPKGEKLLRQLALLHRDQLVDLQEVLKVPGADLFSHEK